MTSRPDRQPFVARRPLHFERVAWAAARAAIDPHQRGIVGNVKALWPDDVVTRAAVNPAMAGAANWANTLAPNIVGDFVANLPPISAMGKLIDASPRVSLDGANSIKFPARDVAIAANAAAWVDEGAPAPTVKFSLGNTVTLGPTKKLIMQVVATRELIEYASGQETLSTMVRETTAYNLDATAFSTTAATSARPAGIMNGVAGLTPTAGGGDTALLGDLEQLASAIAPTTSGKLVFVTNPAQANAVRLRRGTLLPSDIEVWPSIAVPNATVICLDPTAFCSAFGSQPDISASAETLIHMEDATPLPISTVATPNVVSAPLRSAFQTDCVVIKLRLYAAWTWRVSGAVSWLASCTW